MGNKYKLLKDIIPLFPKECDIFLDGFGGSGVVSMNYQGTEETIYNEFNENIISLIKMILNNSPEELDRYWNSLIDEFNLPKMSVSSSDRLEREEYKRRAVSFNKLRDHYNKSKERDYRELFLLIRYSINHLIRFNSNSEFNASNGCDAYNESILKDVTNMNKIFKKVTISCHDFFKLDLSKLTTNSFVYCDCLYTNTSAVYNEKRAFGGWSIEDDKKLFKVLENLNNRGIKWGLSNVFTNKGETNNDLIQWCNSNNWEVYHLKREYNVFNTKNKSNTDEVYITNLKQKLPSLTYSLW